MLFSRLILCGITLFYAVNAWGECKLNQVVFDKMWRDFQATRTSPQLQGAVKKANKVSLIDLYVNWARVRGEVEQEIGMKCSKDEGKCEERVFTVTSPKQSLCKNEN